MTDQDPQEKFYASVPTRFDDLAALMLLVRIFGLLAAGFVIFNTLTGGATARDTLFSDLAIVVAAYLGLYALTRLVDVLIAHERGQRTTNQLLYQLFKARRRE